MSALAQELRALAESFWRAGDYRTAASYHEHALKIESHAVADFDLIGQEPVGSQVGDQGLSIGMDGG